MKTLACFYAGAAVNCFENKVNQFTAARTSYETRAAQSRPRYAPTMRALCFLILFTLITVGDMSCNRKSQWNINSTIGWKSPDPDDFVILILKEKVAQTEGEYGDKMKQLDSTLTKELASKKLGSRVENGDSENAELHYEVSSEFKPALEVILKSIKEFELHVVVIKRKYGHDGSWNDEVL